jgi:hypothetical protein
MPGGGIDAGIVAGRANPGGGIDAGMVGGRDMLGDIGCAVGGRDIA